MTIEFYEDEVLVDGSAYGTLTFDKEQGLWVLWPVELDDGVGYFDNLPETQETIADELRAYTDIA